MGIDCHCCCSSSAWSAWRCSDTTTCSSAANTIRSRTMTVTCSVSSPSVVWSSSPRPSSWHTSSDQKSHLVSWVYILHHVVVIVWRLTVSLIFLDLFWWDAVGWRGTVSINVADLGNILESWIYWAFFQGADFNLMPIDSWEWINHHQSESGWLKWIQWLINALLIWLNWNNGIHWFCRRFNDFVQSMPTSEIAMRVISFWIVFECFSIHFLSVFPSIYLSIYLYLLNLPTGFDLFLNGIRLAPDSRNSGAGLLLDLPEPTRKYECRKITRGKTQSFHPIDSNLVSKLTAELPGSIITQSILISNLICNLLFSHFPTLIHIDRWINQRIISLMLFLFHRRGGG